MPWRHLLVAMVVSAHTLGAQQLGTNTPQSALSVMADNRTAASAASRGVPRGDNRARVGDVLRYRLTFTNVVGRPVRGVTLSNPLSNGVELVGGSTRASREDANAEFSADGGKTFSVAPIERVMIDGLMVERPIPHERFTHVRWTVDGWVQPNATVVAEFDARVAARTTAAPEDSSGRSRR